MKNIREQQNIPKIHFKAKLFKINSWLLLRLPKSTSAKLPSRGLTMVKGTLNGFPFQTALEPDGAGSHWFRLNETLRKAAKIDEGDTVTLSIEPTKEWPEPEVPLDLKKIRSQLKKAVQLPSMPELS